ncbi:MAG TPA: SRPBCC family protein [Candidatus Binataceae bacterium]|nr:SRPBCC family protein [Candidatus Binataceae bacterium]
MNRVYYSTVIDHPADRVWGMIRDFNSYPVWVEGIDESHIEEGKSGDAVGAIRNFSSGDTRIRQRLLAHSDVDRSYTFESCETLGAITYYRGTGRVTPIVDGNRAFVEWCTVFECVDAERGNCAAFFEEGTPQWLKSLRATLDRITHD